MSTLLDPWQLAPKVGLTVADDLTVRRLLQNHEPSLWGSPKWSGGVYPRALPDGSRLCILNPGHSPRRNKITLMEEIAHIYLNHVPSRLVLIADNIQVRDFEKAQEHEAYGVGAAALLPWGSFFPQVNSGYTIRRLAEEFDVTPDLIQYRIKITAAYRLYRARQLGRVQAKVSRR